MGDDQPGCRVAGARLGLLQIGAKFSLLIATQSRHLGSHHGSVCLIKISQGQRRVVAGFLQVAIEEMPGQF